MECEILKLAPTGVTCRFLHVIQPRRPDLAYWDLQLSFSPTPNEGEANNNDHKSTLPGSPSVHRDILSLSLSSILCKSARIDHRALSRLRRRGDMHPPYREAISSRCSLKKKSTDRFFFHLKDHSFAPPSPLIQGALPPGKRTRLRVRVLRRQSSQ